VGAGGIVGIAFTFPPPDGPPDHVVTVDVEADNVASYDVARRATAGDRNAVAGVAADDVPGTGRRAADGVARRFVLDQDAAGAVTEARRPRGVGADVVAIDKAARSQDEGDADASVAADDVPRRSRQPADGHAGAFKENAVRAIGERGCPSGI